MKKFGVARNTVVLDLYLGDSGKGKIVDYLAREHSSVVRFNGSNNAGHTLYVDGKQYKTHCVPSGVLHPHTTNFIAHGCAMDPHVLATEIKQFKEYNKNIYISGQAHVIFPYHIKTDCDREKMNGIGSTKRGVSPAYESKVIRKGIRYEDFLLSRNDFIDKAQRVFEESLRPVSECKVEAAKLYDLVSNSGMKDNIVKDGVSFIHDLSDKGSLLFEGAQGCFLDVDVGDYPYVTSSNCTIGSVLTGTGLNLKDIHEVVGVIKAYGSYVGTNKNFNDIPESDLNDKLCDLGKEYGATTGRRRRLCWLDLDKISQAVRINGPTKLVVTRLDTLGQMPVIKVKYKNELVNFEPWGDISSIKSIKDLPTSARMFIEFIESTLKTPIWAIGNGPNREDLLLR